MSWPLPMQARMEPAPLIRAENLTKCYHLWNKPADRLIAASLETLGRSALAPAAARRWLGRKAAELSRPFFALSDVSFSLGRGDSLGIIGRNGSGKSTLLQILAGTLTPTSGTYALSGRVAALLELGSGFNPEFTGRENVFLQAALAGVPRAAAQAHFEEVAEFAGIGEFIEQPVKTYSSGMMVRLAFATQTILRPDVFIVDEALAVGDIFFQAKCARFFQERLAEGMSLLFVSHDLTSVKALCRRALVLDAGKSAFLGESAAAVSHFHHLHTARVGQRPQDLSSPETSKFRGLPEAAPLRNWPATTEIGSREAEIVHCRIVDVEGRESRSFAVGETFTLEAYIQARCTLDQVQFAVEVVDRHNRVIYGVSSIHLGMAYQRLDEGQTLCFRVKFQPRLGIGDYLLDAALGMGDRGDGAPAQHVHRVARIAAFSIRNGSVKTPFLGPVDLGATMEARCA